MSTMCPRNPWRWWKSTSSSIAACSVSFSVCRFGTSASRFSPYLGLVPELLLQESTFTLPSNVNRSGNAVVFGLTAMLGASYKVGPGGIFAEAGYRGTTVSDFQYAGLGMKGGSFTLGYRFVLGSSVK